MSALLSIIILNWFSSVEPPAKAYAVSNIPDNLRSGVDAVIRVDKMHFDIISKDEAVLKVHQVVTIMNEDASRYAIFYKGYDDFRKIRKVTGQTYDEFGNEMNKLKKTDIIDRSAVGGGTFVGDSRIKVADLRETKYPYSVEYEYEMVYDGLFFYPDWWVVNGYEVSTEGSEFTLTYPEELKPRFKEVNFNKGPDIKTAHSTGILHWEIGNVMPLKTEPYSLGFTKLAQHVIFGPKVFSIDGYTGTMTTWEEFGKWFWELNQGRDKLDPATISQLKSITADASNEREKIQRIYEYMQSKTRYVSIQLGIGGWQSYPANFVDENGWGDCKALSNYMYSMLKALDIESNWVLIRAGATAPDIQPDFPSNQFNHMILNVPLENDTIWLECTSQKAPFDYLGSFTDNRHALMITENGAAVVKTPAFEMENSIQSRHIDVTLDRDGNTKAEIVTKYQGGEYENNGIHFKIHDSHDDQKKWLYNRIDLPSVRITDFSFKEDKSGVPAIIEKISLELDGYAKVSGKRIFVELNLINRRKYIPKKMTERKTHVVIRRGYQHIDTVRFHIPDGIHPETTAENRVIDSKFGIYESDVKVEQNSVTYIRKLIVYPSELPAKHYQELVDFYKAISKADKARIVFLKST